MNEFLQSVAGSPFSGGLCAVAALLASFGLGRALSAAIGIEWRHPLFRDVSLCVLGLDVFALLVSLASYTAASPYVPHLFWLAAIPFSISGLCLLVRSGRLFRAKTLVPILILLLPFAFCAASALCPPVGWDELVYQLAVPRRWLEAGHATIQPDLPYSAFPCLPQFLYWPLMGPGGAVAAKSLSFAIFALLAVSAFLLCRLRCSAKCATVFALAFVLSPIVNGLSKEAYAEQFIAVNLAAALLLLKGVSPKGGFKAATFAGIFAGAVAAVKLTGAFAGAAIAAMTLLSKEVSRRTALPLVLAAALFPASFYLRPALGAGNPLHPYFAGLFTADAPTLESSRFHHAIGFEKYGADGVPGFLLTPFILGVPALDKVNDGSYGMQLFLLLLLAALHLRESVLSHGVVRFLRSPASALAVSIALLYVAWFLSARQARFLLPAFLLLLILSPGFLRSLSPKLKTAALAVLLLLSALSFPPKAIKHFSICWKCVTGGISQADFIYSGTGEGYLHAVNALSTETGSGARPLLLFEERTLYMPRRCVIGTPFMQAAIFTPPDAITPAALEKALSESPFTHILARSPKDNPDLLPGYIDRSMGLLDSVAALEEAKFLKALWRDRGYALFEIAGRAQK